TKPLGLEPVGTKPVTCERPADGVTEELPAVDPALGKQTPVGADPGPARRLPAGELVAPGVTSLASPEEGSGS
ncbi:MAG TPA: hypothetical protein VFP72_09660, partial [Kineosporiaceae bacterium]|nr:hypothetical protein [Kineosporiaceae bacterium]